MFDLKAPQCPFRRFLDVFRPPRSAVYFGLRANTFCGVPQLQGANDFRHCRRGGHREIMLPTEIHPGRPFFAGSAEAFASHLFPKFESPAISAMRFAESSCLRFKVCV